MMKTKHQGGRNEVMRLQVVLVGLLLFWVIGSAMLMRDTRTMHHHHHHNHHEEHDDMHHEHDTIQESHSITNDNNKPNTAVSPFTYWLSNPLPSTTNYLAFGAASNPSLYITFEDDAGGWNNIRMAFECFVLMAKLTGRTLVLPPRTRMYLLDTGPISAFDKTAARHGEKWTSGYEDYYDLEDLKRGGVNFITTTQFFQLHATTTLLSSIPKDALVADLALPNGHHSAYFLALRSLPDVYIWPSGPQTHPIFASSPTPENLAKLGDGKRIIHFPMHISKNLRYLYGVPTLLGCRLNKCDAQFALNAMLFMKYHLHYRIEIAEAARRVVDMLGGPLSFSAMHVRRNELQYKDVFLPAYKSLDNVKALFKPGEKIYIATDETDPQFFHAFELAGHPYVLMRHLKWDLPDELLQKHLGHVEQLVCASARVFTGTSMSTLTSYIFRLRKYMAPTLAPLGYDLQLRYHDGRSHSGGMFANDAEFAPPSM